MIIIGDKKDCCGCWGCYNVCPKRCISMKEDNEGFCYPIIDTTLCIECHLCEKVCPILNVEQEKCFPQKAYLIQHRDNAILRQSTSGGAFTAIGQWVIRQGGVVLGAAYDDNFVIRHCVVDNEEQLYKFRNSKYTQSLIEDNYRQVKSYLKEGRLVCFSGTPCQIEGLYMYLQKKKYPNLILVDLVCHAIPSPLVFRKYLALKKEKIGGQFTDVLFRDKYYGYKYSTMSLYNTERKKNYHEGVDTDVMLRAFFANMSVRPACYQCVFKKQYRVSDITIWDCFDVCKFSKEFNDDRGVTRALIHTDKGNDVIQGIQAYAKILLIDVEKAVNGVKEMKQSVPYNLEREHFFEDLNSMPTEKCFDKYFPKTIRSQIEKFSRLTMNRWGMYSFMKKIFMIMFPKKVAIKK